jgi:hypothetical protein
MDSMKENVIDLIKRFCHDLDEGSYLFQVGGSLLDHETHDLDIVVLFPNITPEDVGCCKENANHWGFDEFELKPIYDGAIQSFSSSKGSFDPDVKEVFKLDLVTETYDLVVKSKCLGVEVDLLMMFGEELTPDFIKNRLSFFPLSIQQIALDLQTGELIKSIWQDSEIIWYGSHCLSLNKYREYYPDRVFKNIRELYCQRKMKLIPGSPYCLLDDFWVNN